MALFPPMPNRPPAVHPGARPLVIQGSFLGNRLQLPTRAPRSGAVQLSTRGPATQLPPALLNLRPRGTGQRLPETIQRKMEEFFKADFSDVRVHVGHEASSIGAQAFTHGSDIYFAHGQYNPNLSHGQRLIGHELTHVLQQRAGRVRNPFGSGVAVIQDHGLEAEAERMGGRALGAISAENVARTRGLPQSPGNRNVRGSIQRKPALQGVIQRWKSPFYEGELGDDQWLVALVNENTSSHGHTVLLIQGPGWTQSINFMPPQTVVSTVSGQERELTLSEKATGRRNSRGEMVPGIIEERSRPGENDPHLSPQIASSNTAIPITIEQGQRLQGIIEEEKKNPPPYAMVGDPSEAFGLKPTSWYLKSATRGPR